MLKTLMLRKKIADAKTALEALRAMESEFVTRSEELQTREAEIADAINEASTEEEQKAVEEAAAAYDADKAALEGEKEENAQKISDLEGEVAEMEQELNEAESQQRAAKVQQPSHDEPSKKITERNFKTMFKTRSLNTMTHEEREALIQREDVQKTIENVRALMQKREVSGVDKLVGVTTFELIRQNVLDYSKLWKYVKVTFTNKDGRQPIEGELPEAIWTECCANINELSLLFTDIELDCHKVAGFFSICNAKLEDADIDLYDTLVDALNSALGKAVDKAIIYGTGVKMPTGVVTAINADNTLKTTNLITIPSTAKGVELFKEIIMASAKADSSYAKGMKLWIVNEATRMKLVAEGLSVNAAGAIVTGVNGKMPVDGGDLVVLPFIPDDNIIVGYFDLYSMLVKRDFTISSSTEVRFIEDQTVIKGSARMDGKPAVKAAFAAMGIGAAPATSVVFPTPTAAAASAEG